MKREKRSPTTGGQVWLLLVMVPGWLCLCSRILLAQPLENYDQQVQEWIRHLGDPETEVRREAVEQLGRVVPQAQDPATHQIGVRGLAERLEDPNEGVRMVAAAALQHISEKVTGEAVWQPVVAHLIKAFQDENSFVRLQLGMISLAVASSVSDPAALAGLARALTEAMDDPEDSVRAFAVIAFARVADKHPDQRALQPALPPLTAALQHPEKDVRKIAAQVLGGIIAHVAQQAPTGTESHGRTPPLSSEDRAKWRELVQLPAVRIQVGFKISPEAFRDEEEPANIKEEIASLQQQLTNDSRDAERYHALGRLYKEQEQEDQAQEAFSQAVEWYRQRVAAQPASGPLLRQLGQALDAAGEKEEAEAVLRQATQVGPHEWGSWKELGAFLQGSAFARIIRGDREVGEIEDGMSLARVWAEMGEHGASPEDLDKAEKMIAEAEACYDRAVAVAPHQPGPYLERFAFRTWFRSLVRALIHALRQGEKAGAPSSPPISPAGLPDLWRAVELGDSDCRHLGVAVLFEVMLQGIQSGEGLDGGWERLPEESRQRVVWAQHRLEELAAGPDPQVAAEAFETLGIWHFLVFQDPTAAETVARRAVALDPSREQAWEILSWALAETDRYPDLVTLCQERLQHQESGPIYVMLAKAYHKGERPEKVEEPLRAAVRVDPDHLTAHLALAAWLMKQSEGEAALHEAGERIARARQLFPKEPSDTDQANFFFVRGMYLALRGEVRQARLELEKVQQNPDEKWVKRATASLQVLASLPEDAEETGGVRRAVEGLKEVLQDEEAIVRVPAALSLVQIGDAAKDPALGAGAVPPLAALLGDDDVTVRQHATGALWLMAQSADPGPFLQPAVEPLVAALSDADPGVRNNALGALLMTIHGLDAPAFWRSVVPAVQQQALTGETGAGPRAHLVWGHLGLKIEDQAILEKAIPGVLPNLRDEKTDVRKWASVLLAEIAPAIAAKDLLQSAIMPLAGALDDAEATVREKAAGALINIAGNLRNEAALGPAIPPLLKALRDEIVAVRRNAIGALFNALEVLQDEAMLTVPIGPLTEALADEDSEVRLLASAALGSIAQKAQEGTAFVPVLSPLTGTLGDEYVEVRQNAAVALAHIAPKIQAEAAMAAIIPPLTETLADENSKIRQNVAGVLAHIALKVQDEAALKLILQPLVETLRDPNADVRRNAAVALRNAMKTIQEEGCLTATVPALAEALRDEDSGVCEHASGALLNVARKTQDVETFGPTVPSVIEAIRHPSQTVAVRVAQILEAVAEKIADPAPLQSAVAPLAETLQHEEPHLRAHTAVALAQVAFRLEDDTALQTVSSPLIEALNAECSEARSHAAAALECLGTAEAKEALEKYRQPGK